MKESESMTCEKLTRAQRPFTLQKTRFWGPASHLFWGRRLQRLVWAVLRCVEGSADGGVRKRISCLGGSERLISKGFEYQMATAWECSRGLCRGYSELAFEFRTPDQGSPFPWLLFPILNLTEGLPHSPEPAVPPLPH